MNAGRLLELRPSRRSRCAALAVAAAYLALAGAPTLASSTVYRWVDAAGVVHLSSEKPPAGVTYEKLAVSSSTSRATTTRSSDSAGSRSASRASTGSSAAQSAQRGEVLVSLQNRECVIALEALDRLDRGREPAEPVERRRLQQTVNQNCSHDPARRREQEEMAARLRVAQGDVCIQARNKLATMLEPGQHPSREQLKLQQEFIESHCKAPVR